MKKLVLMLFLLAPMLHGATWYVRPDGGTLTQCTGHANAAYPGSGTGQACAAGDLRYLVSPNTGTNTPASSWLIAGGDTVHIAAMQNRIGWNGASAYGGFGEAGDPYNSGLPPIPSGTSGAPTTIIGAGEAQTQLFGGYGVRAVISLAGSKWVTLQDFELTDHGTCFKGGVGHQCVTSPPLDEYADEGILTDSGTANIVMTNLNIHGFDSRGIIGPIGGSVITNNVRIAFNGGAGWDFDDGANTPMGPGAHAYMHGILIEWNGCNEEYPITHAIPALACFDQSHAGYGDGVGTPDTTGLDVTVDQGSVFRYNTQDGLDLLHDNGSAILIQNSSSYGNMGQQWKIGKVASAIFQNNLAVHNCNRLSAPFTGAPSNYNANLSDFCRASGDGIAIVIPPTGGHVVLENNTVVTYGSTTYDISCDRNEATVTCSINDSPITFRNNLHIGYTTVQGNPPQPFYDSTNNPGQGTTFQSQWFAANDHNIFYNFRAPVPGSTTVDPLLVGEPSIANHGYGINEADFDAFALTLKPTSSSPAIGAGATIAGLTTDFAGVTRPSPPSIGAYEYAAGPPPPVTGNTNMELDTDWLQPGNVGNTGGGSAAPHGTYTQTPGNPATWSIVPASTPYDTFFFYRQLATPGDAFNRYTYSLDVQYPTTADLNASQAWEFETQQNTGNKVYNCGWQADIKGSGFWRYFNYTTSSWVPTSIPVSASTFPAGTWVTVSAQCTRSAGSITFDTLTVAGTTYTINATLAGFPKTETGPASYINAGFQLDSNGLATPTPYTMKTRNMNTTQTTFTPAPTISSIAIALSPASTFVGGTSSVVCTTTFSDGTHPACSGTLNSASTSVATASGLTLTAVGTGTSAITYTQGGVTSNTATLTVATPSLQSISITLTPSSILVGGTATVTCTTTWTDGTHPACAGSLSSSAVSVASVSGLTLTGAGVGSATIRYVQGAVQSNALTLSVSSPASPTATPFGGNILIGMGLMMPWIKIANEGETRTIPTAMVIPGQMMRYGVGTKWVYQPAVAGNVTASQAFFGAEPGPKGTNELDLQGVFLGVK